LEEGELLASKGPKSPGRFSRKSFRESVKTSKTALDKSDKSFGIKFPSAMETGRERRKKIEENFLTHIPSFKKEKEDSYKKVESEILRIEVDVKRREKEFPEGVLLAHLQYVTLSQIMQAGYTVPDALLFRMLLYEAKAMTVLVQANKLWNAKLKSEKKTELDKALFFIEAPFIELLQYDLSLRLAFKRSPEKYQESLLFQGIKEARVIFRHLEQIFQRPFGVEKYNLVFLFDFYLNSSPSIEGNIYLKNVLSRIDKVSETSQDLMLLHYLHIIVTEKIFMDPTIIKTSFGLLNREIASIALKLEERIRILNKE